MRVCYHRVILFGSVGAVLAAASPTAAQVAHPCRRGQTQLALSQCAADEFQASDRQLNQTYRGVLARLDRREATALRVAQRAWLQFRDAECTYVAAPYEGGSMQSMQRLTCLAELTRARTQQLRAHAPER